MTNEARKLDPTRHQETLWNSDDLPQNPCANCGTCEATIFNGCSLYDGEGVCSKECLDEHDDLGCPLGEPLPAGHYFRMCPHG